jgi:predicted HicB family RNase H-like nuclease
VDDYLAFCAQRGEEPEPPFSRRFMVRITSDQHRLAVMAAKKAGQSLNAWVAEHISKEAFREVTVDGDNTSPAN